MDFPSYFHILHGMVQGVFFNLGSSTFGQKAFFYLLNSRGGPQSFDFDFTTYCYPLPTTDSLLNIWPRLFLPIKLKTVYYAVLT